MITLKNLRKVLACAGLMACVAGAASAADIKANLMLKGELFRAEKDKVTKDVDYYYLMNNQTNQIDNPGDGLEIDMDAGLCGAHLALWYVSAKEAGGENQWAAYFRRSYGWFKPIDSLKIRLGYVGCDNFFKEKIDEWKVGSPFALAERNWDVHPDYINCNDVEGWGFGVEYKPMDNLIFNAGITPGAKGSISSNNYKNSAGIYNEEGDSKTYIAPWGAGVKYYWNQFEFQLSYRDGGRKTDTHENTWSVLRMGAGISNENTYAFVQPILGFDWNAKDEKYDMEGICLDLYGEYYWDAFTFMVHAPVTFRWSGDKKDLNYMEFNAKVKYNTGSHGNLDDVTPYVMIGSNQDDGKWNKVYTRAWALDNHFRDSFNLSYTAGVGFKVGACELDVGLKYDMFSKWHKDLNKVEYAFSVPFSMKFKQF